MVGVKTGSQVWTAHPFAAALAFAWQLVQLWILPGEFAARPLVGALVFLAAVCEGLLAASLLLLGSGRWAVRLGIVLNTTIVFVWIVTRFWGFPAAVWFARLPVEPLTGPRGEGDGGRADRASGRDRPACEEGSQEEDAIKDVRKEKAGERKVFAVTTPLSDVKRVSRAPGGGQEVDGRRTCNALHSQGGSIRTRRQSIEGRRRRYCWSGHRQAGWPDRTGTAGQGRVVRVPRGVRPGEGPGLPLGPRQRKDGFHDLDRHRRVHGGGDRRRSPLPDKLFVAGESPTFHELVGETEAGLGRPITVNRPDTPADMDAEIARRLQAEPDNMFSWMPLMYWCAMLNGKGKLGPLMNARYPAIHPTGVREYVKGMAAGKA